MEGGCVDNGFVEISFGKMGFWKLAAWKLDFGIELLMLLSEFKLKINYTS